MYNKLCVHCKGKFITRKSMQLVCSNKCRRDRARAQWTDGRQASNCKLSTGTVGAISELRVSVDLLQKGFEVFRALSQSCSCDLAVLKDGKLLRIEVRTAYRSMAGKTLISNKKHRADHLAMAFGDSIVYEPALPD